MRLQSSKYNWPFKEVLLAVIIVGIGIMTYFAVKENPVVVEKPKIIQPENYALEKAKVVRIIDGETFETDSGQRIRLLCLDAPEIGRNRSEEASFYLSSLVLNREVLLERDVQDYDEYGNSLRYVYVPDPILKNDYIFVNKELVKNGYAELFVYGTATKLCNTIASG